MQTLLVTDDDAVNGGFHMDVANGTQPDDGLCNAARGLKTTVVLVCNSTAKWTNQDLTGYVIAVHGAVEPCTVCHHYNFTMCVEVV